jgi:murein DD-endopeptidase MepM/ murein hydrolase activator NlpD
MIRNKLFKNIFLLLSIFLLVGIMKACAANTTEILIIPTDVIQGEPVLIQINGAKISDIKNLTFDGKNLNIFNYENKPSALLGIDLNKKSGNYNISLKFKNGSTTESTLIVKDREKYESPLAVPEKLGGNSPVNQAKVVSILEKENAVLVKIITGIKSFWTNKFIYPISGPIVVTDEYGYSRLTGAYTITHKGVDFRAKEGTRVVAMNRGVVRIAKAFEVYGKTVVVDHGFGVMTFYMHLSKIKVNVGELVLPGQLVGLSGQTGYAENPHLHITVRINNISIDPIKFLDLFK